MNFYLITTVIILFSTTTACSWHLQSGSPKTPDKLWANSVEELPNLPQESKPFAPGEGSSQISSEPISKSERTPVETPVQTPVETPVQSSVQSPEVFLKEALESFQHSQDFWRKGDFKNAIVALDQAYALILQVNPDGDQVQAQEKEKIRFMVCRRMLEIYATQHTSAEGSQKAIPLVLNRYVEREIHQFKGPERNFFVEAYKRSGRYRPLIMTALEKAGLPKELSWLPLIESGFRADAFSSARALGMWQFIPSTGYKFGLKRDRWLDERMDAQKSTQAAIAYLQELHNIFGDWCTVLAAYNCGEGRVLEVIRTQRINYLDNFWDLFEKLPQETARYVPRFIAALLIISDPGRFGFDLEEPHSPLPYESVNISKQMALKDVARVLEVSSESIETLNPELRLRITPSESYDLKVPDGKGDLLLSKINEIPVSNFSPKLYALHQVQSGETLIQLAGRYRTSVKTIVEINHIREKDFLRVGQKLKIPLKGTTVGKETEAEAEIVTARNSGPLRYRVKKGDSLRNIAQHYKTNLDEIMRLNHLKSIHLRIDQELLIPPGK